MASQAPRKPKAGPTATVSPGLQRLEAITLNGKVGEFELNPMFAGKLQGTKGQQADTAACQPLAALLGYQLPAQPETVVHRDFEWSPQAAVTEAAVWVAS